VLVPCTFTYPASYYTDNFWDYRPDTRLYGYWYKDPANESQDPPVASSDPSRGVSQETQGRFRLAGELVYGDCSLLIREAQWRDTGRYFFRFEKGTLKYSYLFNSDGTDAKVAISVPVVAASQLLSGGSLGGPNPPEGDSLSLSCEVGSRSKGTLSWAKGNESLSPGQEGAGHLELPNLSRGDAGEYWCWVKNSYGLASRTLRVHVQSKELGGARPQGGSSVEGAGLQGKVEAPLGACTPNAGNAFAGRVGEMRLGQPMQSAQQGLPGVSALLLTQGHKTPAACRTKGVQDEAAAAQAPLGPGEPDELHYATINFSKLQRKLGEPPEAPDMEYSEVRLK
uniref:Ig-like domain-containing protein n=1 Tax=Gopherus agassizii TaxID=38772 RepID=A0A452ICC7_9SAUR